MPPAAGSRAPVRDTISSSPEASDHCAGVPPDTRDPLLSTLRRFFHSAGLPGGGPLLRDVFGAGQVVGNEAIS